MQHPHGRNVGRQLILTWSNCSRIQSNRSCYLCNNRLKQNTVKQFLSVETVGRQKSPGSKSADFLCSHDLFLSLNFCQHAQQNPAGQKTFSLFFFSARPHEVVCFSYKLKLVNVFVRRIRLHFVNNRLRQSQHSSGFTFEILFCRPQKSNDKNRPICECGRPTTIAGLYSA